VKGIEPSHSEAGLFDQGLELAMLLRGIKLTPRPTINMPVKQMQFMRFDGKAWNRFGESGRRTDVAPTVVRCAHRRSSVSAKRSRPHERNVEMQTASSAAQIWMSAYFRSELTLPCSALPHFHPGQTAPHVCVSKGPFRHQAPITLSTTFVSLADSPLVTCIFQARPESVAVGLTII